MPKATPPRHEPLRRRISIPQVDTSTQRWWEAQDDPSVSIRLLIREEIEKNGYVDKLNHPVEQQPRRGRPPAGAERQDVEPDDDVQPAQSGSEPEQPSRTAVTSASASTSTNRASAAMDPAPADDADDAASTDDTDSTDSASALDDLMNN